MRVLPEQAPVCWQWRTMSRAHLRGQSEQAESRPRCSSASTSEPKPRPRASMQRTDSGLSSYRTTLNQRDTVTDGEEKANLLKICHKRCAERTLRVLEKNGGIFIKLGQHLV